MALVAALALRWVLLAAAVVLAAWVLPDVALRGGPVSALVVAALIALATVVAQGVLRVLPSPDNLLLDAVLALAVTGVAVWIASGLTTRLRIDGPLSAVLFVLVVSALAVALGWLAARLLERRGPA